MEKTMTVQWAFDLALGATLIWLAWRLLTSSDLFKSIILFISFGMIMSLVWVRLQAPDIALAEAAIGAGLTGALLLSAFGEIGYNSADQRTANGVPFERGTITLNFVLFLAISAGFLFLASLISELPASCIGLSEKVCSKLESSGAKSAVTAVLLNFRGYDTLLEITVMLVSVLGIWSLGTDRERREDFPAGPVLVGFIRPLIPLMILVASYLLWSGKDGVGGAFQAGAILGAAGVILLLSDVPLLPLPGDGLVRFALVFGLIVFVLVALGSMAAGNRFLEYPRDFAGNLMLAVEFAVTISIGITLAMLFHGKKPTRHEDEQEETTGSTST